MRIGIVSHNGRHVGGTETYLGELIPALMNAGHAVAAWFEAADGSGPALVPAGCGIPMWTAGADIAGVPSTIHELDRWKPDVLFVHGLRSLSTEQAMLEIAPAVAFAHSYYGTCISGHKCRSFPVIAACDRRFGAACLAQFYPRRCGGLNPVTMLRQFRLQRGRLRVLASYTRIAVASHHMALEYERHGLGEKVRLVGLPAPTRDVNNETGDRGDGCRLLYLGRLESTKGVPLLLESAAIVASRINRPIRLDIAGEGSLRKPLEASAARLAATHPNLTVRFHGYLAAEACDGLIATADLLLVPSLWPEPFGLVGLEAAIHGVPAVAFDTGGIRDWLADGVTGVLVDGVWPDAKRFADAVVRCISDRSGLRVMGDKARDRAAMFSIDKHVRRVVDVFEEVLTEHRGHR